MVLVSLSFYPKIFYHREVLENESGIMAYLSENECSDYYMNEAFKQVYEDSKVLIIESAFGFMITLILGILLFYQSLALKIP